MKIASIKVDGFGVWRDLEMDGLAGDVTVLYGPNEAGKTTLMQFVRSMLYGFSPERRERYLPPLRGGTPGGVMAVDTPHGRFDIARRADRGPAAGDVVVTAPDGTQQGEAALKTMLDGVDESIFNNVYACGLREIQELGTLSETEAARYLYELTTGVDRVSLVEVERELAGSLERLLSNSQQASHIGRLLAQRAKLIADLDTARSGMARYHRLAAERESLRGELADAQRHHEQTQHQARLSDLAAALRDKWLERAELSAQLAALGPVAEVPPQAVERLDGLSRRIAARTHREAAEKKRHRQLREEARALPVNEVLWRQGPRIEAIAAQREWIVSLEAQMLASEAELSGLDDQVATLRGRLGIADGVEATSGGFAPRTWRTLRAAAREAAAAKRRLRDAQQAIEAAEAEARATQQELHGRLRAQRESDLAVAMDQRGTLVNQLRRRMQLDERMAQMGHHQTELGEQSHRLLSRQMLPIGVLLGLGSVFVLGTLLVLVGLLMPATLVGKFGWVLAILGLLGTAAAAGAKLLLERAAARELENCQKQLAMLELQTKQAREEQQTLDGQLPRGGGPLAVRLKAAEEDLAGLEALLPIDARRQMALREAQAAGSRAAEVEQSYRQARRAWRRALRAAGLSRGLKPHQVRHLTTAHNQLSGLEARRSACRSQAQQHRLQLASCTQRIAQLAADAGIAADGLNMAAVLERLSADLSEQEALAERREQLSHSARQALAAARRHARRATVLKKRRRALLQAAGAENPEALRRRALARARFEMLTRQHGLLSAEIAAALDSLGLSDVEEQFARQLVDPSSEVLERQRRDAADRVQGSVERLKDLVERQGCLDEQLRVLVTHRGPAELRLDLSLVDSQIQEATRRWQELAVTRLLLDDIHTQFERERQPATLREASQYMNRLTRGHYPRVWTPLGERRLMVDDAAGRPLSAELLSEGTREQLFLSLRLALVARYAQRGIELPLVLDDVLVNFDTERARAAARLLRDFARAGHQLLMFTCHEHIVRVFKALKVETRTLPGREGTAAEPQETSHVEDKEVGPPKVSRRRRKALPAKPVRQSENIVEVEDDDEEISTYGVLSAAEDVPRSRKNRNAHEVDEELEEEELEEEIEEEVELESDAFDDEAEAA